MERRVRELKLKNVTCIICTYFRDSLFPGLPIFSRDRESGDCLHIATQAVYVAQVKVQLQVDLRLLE